MIDFSPGFSNRLEMRVLEKLAGFASNIGAMIKNFAGENSALASKAYGQAAGAAGKRFMNRLPQMFDSMANRGATGMAIGGGLGLANAAANGDNYVSGALNGAMTGGMIGAGSSVVGQGMRAARATAGVGGRLFDRGVAAARKAPATTAMVPRRPVFE